MYIAITVKRKDDTAIQKIINANFVSGVIGNLTNLKVLDMSYNNLESLQAEDGIFNLPANITEIYLSHNRLDSLPEKKLKNASMLSVLDVSYNKLERLSAILTEMVVKNSTVIFEGNDKLIKYLFARRKFRYLYT